MRIAIRSIVAAVILFNALGAWADSIPTVSIQPQTTTVFGGNTFTLDVNISNVSDLFAFQFDLGFNPSILSAVSIMEGSFLPGGGTTFFIPGAIDNVGGTIAATADSLIGLIPGGTGSGTLAEVEFKALGSGTNGISLSNAQLLDSSLSPIPFETAPGSVDVTGVAAVPEPSAVLLVGAALLCVIGLRARVFRRPRRPVGEWTSGGQHLSAPSSGI